MPSRIHSALCVLLFAAGACPASSHQNGDSPAFQTVPELASGFHLLYAQDFPGAREKFDNWESQHPDEPFGEVAVAASYLFEELFRQGVLSSDFFLNEKRFLHGIEGKPDAARMKSFQDALDQARRLAKSRLARNNRDPEALFALTLAAEGSQRICQVLAERTAGRGRRLRGVGRGQLHYREPFGRRAFHALVRRRPRRQEAGHGATGKNHRRGAVFAALCKNLAGISCAKRKTGCGGAKTPARTKRRVSGKLALRRGVCKSDGADHPRADASLRLAASKLHFEKDIQFPPDGLESRCCRERHQRSFRARR